MVVDDDLLVLRAMVRDLRALNYQPVPASDASIALAMLEVRRFDIVLADLHLPIPQGGVFATAAMRTAANIPLVVITGEDSIRRIRDTLQGTRVDAVVPKPYQREELRDVIARALANKRRLSDPGGETETRLIADGLVRALALRDIETENHSRRVSAWTRMLAKAIQINRDYLLQCELGALLHDVGKIGVPDAILKKAAQLSEAEWVEMRKHPRYGREMVAGIHHLREAAEIVYSHHESWDGRGYPRALEAEQIPVGARIFAVVDTYDAMTSERVYRKAMPHHKAIEEIRSLAGKQYDPDVVRALLSVDMEHWQKVRSRFEDPPKDAWAA